MLTSYHQETLEYVQFRARKINKTCFDSIIWKKISFFCFIEEGKRASKDLLIKAGKSDHTHIVFNDLIKQQEETKVFYDEIAEKILKNIDSSQPLITDIKTFGFQYDPKCSHIMFTLLISVERELLREISKSLKKTKERKKRRKTSNLIRISPNAFRSITYELIK
jgi:hypothetical protein